MATAVVASCTAGRPRDCDDLCEVHSATDLLRSLVEGRMSIRLLAISSTAFDLHWYP